MRGVVGRGALLRRLHESFGEHRHEPLPISYSFYSVMVPYGFWVPCREGPYGMLSGLLRGTTARLM